MTARHPLLYQLNTCISLGEIERATRRRVTLDDLPDTTFDSLRAASFDWLWLLGVWRTSPAGLAVARSDPRIRAALEAELPDLSEADFTASPFAIRGYEVRSEWGGDAALSRVRRRLAQRGLRLMLDFVPNHVALDHPWVDEHPEYFVAGTPDDLAREPHNYVQLRSRGKLQVFAHGRDPYFPGWTDTLQLDYRHPGLRRAMTEQLQRLSRMCDGVRCDMAMLVLPDVIERTWGSSHSSLDDAALVSTSFWAEAIAAVRADRPAFVFMAEAYWDLEWRLQSEGFDYTYDKRLYDRLRSGDGRSVREHLRAEPDYQRRSVRFLENHDEPRAAAAFPREVHQAAAVVSFFVPGLRFFHDGELEGRQHHVPMQAARRPAERPDLPLQRFYSRLLECLARPEVHDGEFQLHECRPAWAENGSFEALTVVSWTLGDSRLLVAVNFAPHATQGYVTISIPYLAAHDVRLVDLLGDARYTRSGPELEQRGLYLDLPAWGYHVFDWQTQPSPSGTPP